MKTNEALMCAIYYQYCVSIAGGAEVNLFSWLLVLNTDLRVTAKDESHRGEPQWSNSDKVVNQKM